MSDNVNYSENHHTRKRTWINNHPGYNVDPEEDVLVPMFQVPIAHVKVRDWENKKQKLLKLYQNTLSNAENPEGQFDVTTDYHYNECNGETSYRETINSLLDEEIGVLENLLLPMDHYTEEFVEANANGEEFYFQIENVWFEKSEKYGQHLPHTHGSRGYSCVLYVDYDQEEHDPTIYLNPFYSYFFAANQDWSCPEAKEGSLLCWPASIVHFTQVNGSDKDRLVLSWNLSIINCTGDKVE